MTCEDEDKVADIQRLAGKYVRLFFCNLCLLVYFCLVDSYVFEISLLLMICTM